MPRWPKIDGPLSAARRRLDQKTATNHETRQPAKMPPPDVMIGMAAAGLTQVDIGKAFGVSQGNVHDAIMNVPDAAGFIRDTREKLKTLKIARALQAEPKLWSRLDHELDKPHGKGDAKSIDAILRGLHASEKIQAQVAGEGQKVEVTGEVVPDIKVLIQTLMQG